MSEPEVNVLGVYRLIVTDDLVSEQQSILYPDATLGEARLAAELQIREQLGSVVLIEAVVRQRDTRFDIAHFVQPREDQPRDSWQCAWAEAFLSPDGQSLAAERWSPTPDSGDLRIAFFLHGYDPTRPLRTSYGDIVCPPPQAMPERLARLVPFEPVD